ncbi:MAG: hypothetical protein IKE52_04910 [Mogibacterium sp.]|nr:hypothetical protein [Mogibacterium sp.]
MNSVDLIRNYRFCSEHFNRDEYPELFKRVLADLEIYFDELPHAEAGVISSILQSEADAMLDDIQSNMESHRFKFRRESVLANDQIVISLFILPAAAKLGTPLSTEFAEKLAETWVKRFPGSVMKIGDYDEIVEGFKWKISLTLK